MNSSDHLRDSEQGFRLIVGSIPGLVWTMTAEGEVEFVNQQILDYAGKPIEELRDWRPLVHPDDLAQLMTRWMRSIETGDAYEVEHRFLRADGVYRWFHVRVLPLRDTEGRVVRWCNLLTDIDERSKAGEKLKRSEAYLSEAQTLTPIGSFGWHIVSGEIYWSPETFRIFEYDDLDIEEALCRKPLRHGARRQLPPAEHGGLILANVLQSQPVGGTMEVPREVLDRADVSAGG